MPLVAHLALVWVVTWILLAPLQRARSAGAPRVWRGPLLYVGFAAANALPLVATARIGRFAIFDGWYLATAGAGLPVLAILVLFGRDSGSALDGDDDLARHWTSSPVVRAAFYSAASLAHPWAVSQMSLGD